MAITFTGCGSRVVLCTWAHVFAILDPHSLALLTTCRSLYFGKQVDVGDHVSCFMLSCQYSNRAKVATKVSCSSSAQKQNPMNSKVEVRYCR